MDEVSAEVGNSWDEEGTDQTEGDLSSLHAICMTVDAWKADKITQHRKGRWAHLLMTEQLKYLPVRQGDIAVNALIDSGATINILNPHRVADWKWEVLFSRQQRLTGATGVKHQKVDYVMVSFHLPNGRQSHAIASLDPNFPADLVLGAPWLHQEEAVLNFNRRLLTTSQGTFAWAEEGGRNPAGAQELFQAWIGWTDATEEPATPLLTPEQYGHLAAAFKNTILSKEERAAIYKLFERYAVVWTGEAVACAKGVQHEIKTTTTRPFHTKMRQIPLKWQPAVAKEIEKMLKEGVIEPSNSDCASVPVCVAKPDGSLRFCVDYRKLNAITVPDRHPLPLIQDLLQITAGSTYFALLDLRAGFWQIPMAANSKYLTAFRTHQGLYQFRVMPFGLINAPATFQRWVHQLFGDLADRGVLTYIDDLLIHAPTAGEFIKLLAEVLSRLEEAGAKVKIEKAQIAPRSMKYLGHLIEEGTRRPDPGRVEVLQKIVSPRNIKEVRSAIGMFNWFRHYIPHYSEVIRPLTLLTSAKRPFTWDQKAEAALRSLAKTLQTATLGVPPIGQAFRLETDASDIAIGAVLYSKEQYDADPNSLPILYISKTLTPAEQNWSAGEREAFAIVWALGKTDGFVRGREVEVVTDHKNLQWMLKKDKGKIARWTSLLSEYQVSIKHRSGQLQEVADFLSRQIRPDPILDNKATLFAFLAEVRGKRRRLNDDLEVPQAAEGIKGPLRWESSDSEGGKGAVETTADGEVAGGQ